MKKLGLLIITVLLMTALAACSAQEEAAVVNVENNQVETEQGNQTDDHENSSITVEEDMPVDKAFTFMLGADETTVTVPYEPKRIVAVGYDMIDIIDALGAKDRIIGVPDPTGPMFPDYLEGYQDITSVGSLSGDDLEAIAGLKPDLIIAGARATGAYESLSEIAPTTVFTIPGMSGTGFEEKLTDNVKDVAYLLNLEEEGKALLGDLSSKIEQMNEAVEKLENPTAMFLIITGKTVSIYTDNTESRYGFVYNEFGFDPVAGLDEIAEEDKKVNDGEASRHGNSISFEFISAKNPEYIIVIDRGITTGETDISATDVLNNPLVNATNAVKNDNVIILDGAAWYLATGGVETTNIMIDNLLESLGQ